MREMDRPKLAVEVAAEPVVEAERVEVRRRADLEHDVSGPARVRRAGRDQVEAVLLGRVRLQVPPGVEGRRRCDRPLGVVLERADVGVAAQAEVDARARARDHDVVGLVLRVRQPEGLAHVALRGMALDRQVAAFERVQVVEADREREPEPLRDLWAEDAFGMERHQELEADLHRLGGAEEDAALGRDQLVRPREVRRVGVDAERAAKPLPAPRAGQEGGSCPKGPAGQLVERAPQRVSVERARRLGVAQVEVAVDPAGERLLVPVEDGPVDEEQPLLGARPAGRLAEVRNVTLLRCGEGVALRDVRVPEDVVLDERAPGAEHDDDIRVSVRAGTREVRRRSPRAIPRRCGRTRDRREARLRPCAAGFRPTGRTTRARRSKWSTAPRDEAQRRRRPRRDSSGSAEEPSTASTQGVRAASSEAGTSKPLAGGLPETGYHGFGS